MTSARYRAALAEARALLAPAATPPGAPDVAARIAAAAALAARWSAAGGTPPPPALDRAPELLAAWERVTVRMATIGAALPLPDAAATTLEALEAWARALDADVPTLRKLPELQAHLAALVDAGLGELVTAILGRRLGTDDAVVALDGAWASAIVERVLARDPAVGGVDAARLDQEAASYAGLDRDHVTINAARVKRAWAERAVAARDAFPEQDLLVSTQAKRKIGHLPVRDLFAGAPDVLTAVKPCWAMSPLLVSQILPADRPYFDLVVFDEASQILPADAIPSILRGRRAVVAGDDLQLPPTIFFASQTAVDLEDEEGAVALEGAGEILATGFASILDIADPLIGSRPLRWHYRSRDERLIAFSNLQVYRPRHRELTTFPAVTDDECIRHVRVVARPDGASGESSAEEVDAVVRLILEHAQERPEESLGVIAMGLKHAERIGEALRLARAGRPDLDDVFAEGGREPMFVKNLERVQGDERDAIILTIGYGRTAGGRLVHNFGPVNQQGGERRLNVAVTRARRRMVVVSSFGSEDVDPSRSSSEGVRLLRSYLRYAESGGTDLGGVAAPRPELNAIRAGRPGGGARAGHRGRAAAGDVGLLPGLRAAAPAEARPLRPGGRVRRGELSLGAQHPGAGPPASAAARGDRLAVPPDLVDGLVPGAGPGGRAAEGGIRRRRRLGRFICRGCRARGVRGPGHGGHGGGAGRDARCRRPGGRSGPGCRARGGPAAGYHDGGPAGAPAAPIAMPARARGPRPRVFSYGSIDGMPPSQIDAVVAWIESDGLLRTTDEVVEEAMRELGFARRGARIVAAIEASVARTRARRDA